MDLFLFDHLCLNFHVKLLLYQYSYWHILGGPLMLIKAHRGFFLCIWKHLRVCMEGSFIKWRTLPLIVLKCFAIWMKNLYSGEGLLPWAPLNFQGYIPLGYFPQIMGPLGACISLYVKPTLAVSFLVLEERTLHPWIMPWGMVVTSWCKQPSSPPKRRFASYFMLG
jgi:hypothetical protein